MHNVHLVVCNAGSVNEGVSIVTDALNEGMMSNSGSDWYGVIGAVNLDTFEFEMMGNDRYSSIKLTRSGVVELLDALFNVKSNQKALDELVDNLQEYLDNKEFGRLQYHAERADRLAQAIDVATRNEITPEALITNKNIEVGWGNITNFGLTRLTTDRCNILVVLDVHS